MPRSIEYLDETGEDSAGVSRDWGTVSPGDEDAEKRWIRNNGTIALVSVALSLEDVLLNSGVGVFKHALDTVTVRPPYGGTAEEGGAGGGGVLVNDDTWYFRVTRINASGETQGSVEFSYTIADATKEIDLSWTIPSGPSGTGVRVYTTQISGDYTDPDVQIASLGAAVTTFSWDGTAPSGGTFPSANTTDGGASAPALGTGDLSVGSLAVGEARAFWKGYAAPGSAGDETYIVDTTVEEV